MISLQTVKSDPVVPRHRHSKVDDEFMCGNYIVIVSDDVHSVFSTGLTFNLNVTFDAIIQFSRAFTMAALFSKVSVPANLTGLCDSSRNSNALLQW